MVVTARQHFRVQPSESSTIEGEEAAAFRHGKAQLLLVGRAR
jgi:hypothetical protein